MRKGFLLLVISFFMVFVGCAESGKAYYGKGVEYQSAGQIVLAGQQYKLALQENPELAEAYLNLGCIYIEDDWYDGAEINTRKAIEILERTQRTIIKGNTWQQTLSIAYCNLGAIEIGRAIDADYIGMRIYLEKARSFVLKAIELDPSNSKAQSALQSLKKYF